MNSSQGMKLSYKLHALLQQQTGDIINEPVRGSRIVHYTETSVNGSIYSLTRVHRAHRRSFLTSLLNIFDDDMVSLSELVFLCDNMAYFAYQQQDEPLFVIRQIDVTVSVSGSHVLDGFNEIFHPDGKGTDVNNEDDDDDHDDEELLLTLVPANICKLWELYIVSQKYILLLSLKQYLKEVFGFTDSKLLQYSPDAAAKVYNKPLNRKQATMFIPQQILELLQHSLRPPQPFTHCDQRKLVSSYLDFKIRMSNIDRGGDEIEPADAVDHTMVSADVESSDLLEPAVDTASPVDVIESVKKPSPTTVVKSTSSASVDSSSCASKTQQRSRKRRQPSQPKLKAKKSHIQRCDSGSSDDDMDRDPNCY
jgi:cohesin loading factor subunit SCC2